MSCYLVQEIDGTSRFTLEDGSGFLLLEFCPPAPGGDLIAGGRPDTGLEAQLPPRRGRRRRYQQIVTDEEVMTIILMTLDE